MMCQESYKYGILYEDVKIIYKMGFKIRGSGAVACGLQGLAPCDTFLTSVTKHNINTLYLVTSMSRPAHRFVHCCCC